MVNYAFPELPQEARDQVESGSKDVDAWYKQLGGTYKHAMRDPGQSVKEARKKMCEFIKKNLKDYNKYLGMGKNKKAYHSLGMALHPVMDSTSPMHKGFQEWHPYQDGTFHGNAHGSLEGPAALDIETLSRTIDLMNQVENGSLNGLCCN